MSLPEPPPEGSLPTDVSPAHGSAAPAGGIAVHLAETEDEREAVYRFRYHVYVEEMGKTCLSEADHDRRRLTGPLDDQALLFYATAGADVVATVRTNLAAIAGFPASVERIYRGDLFTDFPRAAFSFSSRLMIDRGRRGSAALHLLLGTVYDHVLELGISFDFCNCAPALLQLYQHLGYRRFTDNFVDPEVGYRVPLVLLTRDAEHLRAVRSPFWRKLARRPDLWQSSDVARWLNTRFPVAQQATEWMLNETGFWDFLAGKMYGVREHHMPLLDDLSADEQRRVLQSASILDCRAGDAILRRGDVGNEMFVVLSGTVEVRLPGLVVPLAVFDPGQVFGEIAFIANTTRSADVVALTDAQVLVISQTYLRRLIKAAPELAAKLLFNLSRILCERLACSNEGWAGPLAGDAGRPQ